MISFWPCPLIFPATGRSAISPRPRSRGRRATGASSRFVIHKHSATADHYDLRLEHRWRAEELGGAEGAVAQSRRDKRYAVADRGPSDRIHRLRGRDPRRRVWRRADDRLGHRHLGADGRRRARGSRRATSSSGCGAKSSRAAGCWCGMKPKPGDKPRTTGCSSRRRTPASTPRPTSSRRGPRA